MAAIAPSETVTVQLPADLYEDVREFLSASEAVTDTAVDRFIEAAVGSYLLRKGAQELHAATAHIPAEDVEALVQGAVAQVRTGR